MQTDACQIVASQITHTRYGPPAHLLQRAGLSILIDLDRLEAANRLSAFFLLTALICFLFMKAILALIINRVPTGQPRRCRLPAIYARWLLPILGREIARIQLLAFPRILGIAFNPITIYLCYDAENRPCFYVYEVHNTFGDAHSYISVIDASGQDILQKVDKKLHVSPFFDLQGYYRLSVKQRGDDLIVLVNYARDNRQLLTAAGKNKTPDRPWPVTGIIYQGVLALRPLFSIHIEAVKLFLKKCRFYKRPSLQDPLLWHPPSNRKRARMLMVFTVTA